MKKFKRYVSMLLVISLLFTFALPKAWAEEGQSCATKIIPLLTGNEAASYTSEAIKLDVTKEFRKNYKCDMGNVTVRDFGEFNNSVGVFIPVKDNTGKNYSFFSVSFNKDTKAMIGTSSLVFNKEGDLYHATFKKDNKVVLEGKISEAGTFVEGWRLSPDGTTVDLAGFGMPTDGQVIAQGFWSCFNSCLASQGIAAWAVALLGAICGGVCIVTAGTACFACLGTISFISGGVIGWCLGVCT